MFIFLLVPYYLQEEIKQIFDETPFLLFVEIQPSHDSRSLSHLPFAGMSFTIQKTPQTSAEPRARLKLSSL